MFGKVLKRLFKPKEKAREVIERSRALDHAFELVVQGDRHAAIAAFRAYLATDPTNVAALNDLGACLADVGDTEGAESVFELAYSLDDSYLPVMVNHAKMLTDRRRSEEALPYLDQAKLCDPNFPHVDAVYASHCLNLGDIRRARHYQLRAWLAHFDNLRLANGHLFKTAYDDLDEAELATEHRFWAATLRPFEPAAEVAPLAQQPPPASRRVRIGYWSPDLRNHSVRYFFRPLLENHDRTRFEVFLYHDFPKRDAQTQAMEDACDSFHDVYLKSDQELFALIRSHQLDVLVELAGHSSQNRLPLLQQRFAPVQLTGIGYPPTTGLETLDGKIVDPWLMTPEAPRYYTEPPLVLPNAFWCFDPREEAPIEPLPPVEAKGFVTFGCVGNIAKISDRVLACWVRILAAVPDARLLLRAINFEDEAVPDVLRERLARAGLDLARVDIRRPEGGTAFFTSYNEIDIILDTFPFNGGTTSCFATYMGVPIVTWYGQSLLSRMGLSIVNNLGEPDLAVADADAYVDRAVRLAGDRDFLRRFKREARARYAGSSLGNGARYAAEFEAACLDLLQRRAAPPSAPAWQHAVSVLPARELVRRAYAVLRHDQSAAALRILNHSLAHYPAHGDAHLLAAHLMALDQQFDAARAYLAERVDGWTPPEQIAAHITMARYGQLLDQPEAVGQALDRLRDLPVSDDFDRLQARLFEACIGRLPAAPAPAPLPPARIHVVIPCDTEVRFAALQARLAGLHASGDGRHNVSVERCAELGRAAAYARNLARDDVDVLVLMQKAVTLHDASFFDEVVRAVAAADVAGFAGARRWRRFDWRLDDFDQKAAALVADSSERPGCAEAQWFGETATAIVPGMAVLDGGVLAVRPAAARGVAFDEELAGAEYLMEEDWSHRAWQAGLRLAVSRRLLPQVDRKGEWDNRLRAAGRVHLATRMGFDPFSDLKEDGLMVTAPVHDVPAAVRALLAFATD